LVTQVVEIAENGNHLSKYRGFLVIRCGDDEIGRVPLDDMTALILSAHQITLSKSLITALAECGVPIITSGNNYHPLAITLPYGIHYDQAGVLWAQIESGLSLQKRLWQAVVREKILNQRIILEYFSPTSPVLDELGVLAKRVRSGDTQNMEAQAARQYWPALFGPDFRRDRATGIENISLNYGYTILRAATARAVCGAGLTPALGIHHRNRKNPFALVDDLMEPFRPLVDKIVRQITDEDGARTGDTLSVEDKRRLSRILDMDVRLDKGTSTLMNALNRLAQTLVNSLHEKSNSLEFPAILPAGSLL
jgi:CRISP-associated protein Cas1